MTTTAPAIRSRANLKGSTASELLVHSLAISLVSEENVREVTFVRGPFEGQSKMVGKISMNDLFAVVGKALAPSTLKGILRRHPGLSVTEDKHSIVVTL